MTYICRVQAIVVVLGRLYSHMSNVELVWYGRCFTRRTFSYVYIYAHVIYLLFTVRTYLQFKCMHDMTNCNAQPDAYHALCEVG